jgi:membrane protease YdiL (CAAX protease family)
VPYAYELNVANVLGTLGFQLFLSGTSEEILFRAFPITVLGGVIGKDNKKGYAFIIVIASVLFSVAHIQWSLFPVSLTFSWFQLIYAFIWYIISPYYKNTHNSKEIVS